MRLIVLIIYLFCSLPCLANSKKNDEDEPKILGRISFSENIEEFKSSLFNDFKPQQINNGEVLNFGEFISIVNLNHPNIISADLNRQIARYKRIEAQGAFDPSINSVNSFQRFNSSSALGDTQEVFTSNTSLDFLTGYGAKLGIGAKYAIGDIKTPISPTGEAGEYFIRAQIPLLRDAIYNSQFVKEKTAKLGEAIADFLYFRTKLKTLDSATKTYWDWVAAKQILDIENSLLSLINGQVSFVQEQAKLGNLPEISVVEAQREVQKRTGKVNTALRSLQESSLDLSQYTWTKHGTPYSIISSEQAPKNIIEPTAIIEGEIETAKLNALSKRPEFKALDLSREIFDYERKLAKNQMLPQLDAFVSPGIETGEDSIGPSLEAGVNISLPLRVRTAKGQLKQAELKIKQLNLEERQLVQNVFIEIEDSASALQTTYLRYLAAKQNYELSDKLEQGERARFELGASTLFVVIRRQRSKVEANIELIKAMADYHKANIRFLLVQGELI